MPATVLTPAPGLVRRAGPRRTVLLLVLALVAVLAPAAQARADSPAVEQGLLTRLAGERDRAGVPALVTAPDLTAVARAHAREMADRARVFHDPGVRERVTGWTLLGENIGAGPDAAALHTAFVDDGPSRQTLLDPRWAEVGFGAVAGRNGTVFVTALFRLPDGSATAPSTTDPSTTDPSTTDPGTTDPGTTDPSTRAPGTTGPRSPEPTTAGRPTATRLTTDASIVTSRPAPLPPLPAGADLATRVAALRAAAVPASDPVAGALAWAARMSLLSA